MSHDDMSPSTFVSAPSSHRSRGEPAGRKKFGVWAAADGARERGVVGGAAEGAGPGRGRRPWTGTLELLPYCVYIELCYVG